MITFYHNPRCSKSRQALALLEEHSADLDIVKYLDTPPTAAELKTIIRKLGITPRELLRKLESQYKALGLNNMDLTDTQLIKHMAENPKLIERPIAIKGDIGVVGRPPENVLTLVNHR